MKNIREALNRAASADEAELSALVHHSSQAVVSKTLQNENLTEKLALIIAGRKNIGSDILEALYCDPRWEGSYRIMLALCKNPKTPQKSFSECLRGSRIGLVYLELLSQQSRGGLGGNSEMDWQYAALVRNLYVEDDSLCFPIKIAVRDRVAVICL